MKDASEQHVSAVIRNDSGDVLFLRRHGKLELPGGKIGHGETGAEVIERETRKALDVGVDRLRFVGRALFKHEAKLRWTEFFALKIDRSRIIGSKIVEELVYVDPREMLRFDHDHHEFSPSAMDFRKALRDGEVELEDF